MGAALTWPDRSGKHPVSDYEGAAEAIEAMLRSLPELAGTRLRYRMDYMGQTFEQEDQETLEAAYDHRAVIMKRPGPAGQQVFGPVFGGRPQQDSNLRTRLRRALTVMLVTCPNARKFESLGCVWGAGEGSNRRTSAFREPSYPDLSRQDAARWPDLGAYRA